MNAIRPRGSIPHPSGENTFRVDQEKLAVRTAIADGFAVIESRDRGFAIVLTRHPITREVTGDGGDLLASEDGSPFDLSDTKE